MYSKAAERSADIGDYAKAIELYEQVGDWSLGNSLTKYSVKDYWLRAALCSIAMGVSPVAIRMLNAYRKIV
jgi:alpha-soluble NSF attachment protein